MSRITVVIEDHAEGIHLGQRLAGGRVVAATAGDHSELLEALEQIAWLRTPGECGNKLIEQMERIATQAIAKARAT